MVNPRYDPVENVSRHGAVNRSDCRKIERKYKWELKRIEETEQETLKFDCVFRGETEFPISYYETNDED